MATRHIAYMPLASLTPALRNAKNHDLQSLKASVARYGFTDPIIVDERTTLMVAGHGRREAVIMLKQAGDPPPGGVYVDDDGDWLVPVLRGWESRDDAEAEAYILADNQLTIAGGWHNRSLVEMLEDVVTEDATLIETLGWDADALDELLGNVDPESLDSQTDPDESAPPKTQKCPSCGYTWED